MENTRPLFNQSCLLEIQNEHPIGGSEYSKTGSLKLTCFFIHSAAVCSTLDFLFLLNVAWSAEYHNIPVVHKQTSKNNGLNKQKQAQIPNVFHYFVQRWTMVNPS